MRSIHLWSLWIGDTFHTCISPYDRFWGFFVVRLKSIDYKEEQKALSSNDEDVTIGLTRDRQHKYFGTEKEEVVMSRDSFLPSNQKVTLHITKILQSMILYTHIFNDDMDYEEDSNPSDDNDSKQTDDQEDDSEDSETSLLGKVFTQNGLNYKITSVSTNPAISLMGTSKSKKTLKSITIPDTIKYNGVTFRIKSIGANAFKGYKKLKNITIKSTTLNSVGKNAIKGINKKAKIKVPKKSLKTYKKLFTKETGFGKKMKIKG